jgi:predicted nucleotidyltransferase
MKIERNQVIGGMPAVTVKEILKDRRRLDAFTVGSLAELMHRRIWNAHVDELVKADVLPKDAGIAVKWNEEVYNKPGRQTCKPIPDQTKAARALLRGLLAEGLVERSKNSSGDTFYTTTVKGNAFAGSSFRRMDRARADVLLAGVLERAAEINAREDLLHWVTEIRVFGSYGNGADDLGDLDLAIDLERRPHQEDSFAEASRRMAQASGRRFSSYLEELYYPERLVKQLLKNRSAYVSVHDARELPPDPQFRGRTVYTFAAPAADAEPASPRP